MSILYMNCAGCGASELVIAVNETRDMVSLYCRTCDHTTFTFGVDEVTKDWLKKAECAGCQTGKCRTHH